MEAADKQWFEELFGNLHKQSEHGFEQIDRRFGQIDHRLEEIDHRFEQIDRRFEQIDRRFEEIDRRFEEIDRRFEEIDRRFEEIEQRIERVETTLLTEFHKWASPADMRLRSHAAALRALDLEVEAHDERIQKLEKNN